MMDANREPSAGDPGHLHAAISLALAESRSSKPRPDQVRHFLGYLAAQSLVIDWWSIVEDPSGGSAACLCICSPGRAAMIVVSPTVRGSQLQRTLAQAVGRIIERASDHGTTLMQALISPHDHHRADVLTAVGFNHLATLGYMARAVLPGKWSAPDCMKLIPYPSVDPVEFADVLHSTYTDSLDCPGLTGLRSIDDIISSHAGTGIHDPDLWYLARAPEGPLGVLLLTRVPLRPALEIVYLGVAPHARGCGCGTALVEHALNTAHRCCCDQVILAVDMVNTHAREIYSACGFTLTETRDAWVKPLS
jgi:GNAT superfamily N-acetyltransferase